MVIALERTILSIALVAGLMIGMVAPAAAQQQQNDTRGIQALNQFQLIANCTLIPTQSQQQEMLPMQKQDSRRPVMVCQYYTGDVDQEPGFFEELGNWFQNLGNRTRNQTGQQMPQGPMGQNGTVFR